MKFNLSLWAIALVLFFSNCLVAIEVIVPFRTLDGNYLGTEVDISATRREVYEIAARRVGVPADWLRLVFMGAYQSPDDLQMVSEYGRENTVHVIIRPHVEVVPEEGDPFTVYCPASVSGNVFYTLVGAQIGLPANKIRLFHNTQLIPYEDEILQIVDYVGDGGVRLLRHVHAPVPTVPRSVARDPRARQVKIYGGEKLIPFTIIPEATTNSNLYDLVSAVSGYKVEDLTIRRLGDKVANDDKLIGEVDPHGEVISFLHKPDAQRLARLDAPSEAAAPAAVISTAGPGEIAAAKPIEMVDSASGRAVLPSLKVSDYNNLFELEEFLIQNLGQVQAMLIKLPLDDKQDLASPLNLAKLEKFLMRHRNQNYSRIITLPFGAKSDLVI